MLLQGQPIGDDVEGLAVFRTVGRGIAALTVGPDRRLLWSTDGARFRELARLPPGSPDDVDAVLDADERPSTWFLLTREITADEGRSRDPDGPAALMRLDGDTWSVVRTFDTGQPEGSTRGSVTIDGAHIVVPVEGTVLITLSSGDGGATWVESTGTVAGGYCEPRAAITGDLAVLGCDEADLAILRWTELP
jgi:hypothetical protein